MAADSIIDSSPPVIFAASRPLGLGLGRSSPKPRVPRPVRSASLVGVASPKPRVPRPVRSASAVAVASPTPRGALNWTRPLDLRPDKRAINVCPYQIFNSDSAGKKNSEAVSGRVRPMLGPVDGPTQGKMADWNHAAGISPHFLVGSFHIKKELDGTCSHVV